MKYLPDNKLNISSPLFLLITQKHTKYSKLKCIMEQYLLKFHFNPLVVTFVHSFPKGINPILQFLIVLGT